MGFFVGVRMGGGMVQFILSRKKKTTIKGGFRSNYSIIKGSKCPLNID